MRHLYLLFLFIIFVSCGGPVHDKPVQRGQVKDIDGNEYETVLIGDKWWMAENLRVTRYNDGDTIQSLRFSSHQNDEEFLETFGYLYNWYAVGTGRLCPDGWSVSSDADWKRLERDVLDISRRDLKRFGWRGTYAGRLKETDTLLWRAPNVGASNQFGFNARPGGYAFPEDITANPIEISRAELYVTGSWWTSTMGNYEQPINRTLYFYNNRIGRSNRSELFYKSIRCIRDQ